jgi:hypothetical protein
MIAAIPVHNIYRLCYANEAEDSHVIAIQSGNKFYHPFILDLMESSIFLQKL